MNFWKKHLVYTRTVIISGDYENSLPFLALFGRTAKEWREENPELEDNNIVGISNYEKQLIETFKS